MPAQQRCKPFTAMLCPQKPKNFDVPAIGKWFFAVIALESLLMIILSILLYCFHDPVEYTGQVSVRGAGRVDL